MDNNMRKKQNTNSKRMTLPSKTINKGGSPSSVVNEMLNSDIVINRFEIRSPYYNHFNTQEKGMNASFPAMD